MKVMNYRKTMAWVGFSLFVFLVLTIGMQMLASIAAATWMPEIMEKDWYLWVVSYVPLYVIAFPLFLLVIHLIPTREVAMPENPMQITVKKFLALLVFCMGVTYLLNYISVFLSMGLAVLKGSAVENPLAMMQQGSGLIYNFIFGCIVAPVGEELVFRWVVFKKIGIYGERQYVLLSGFIFALYHMNIFQIPYAFVLGTLLAYLYCKTRRLAVPIALHMTINVIGFMAGPLALQSTVFTIIFMGLVAASIVAAIVLFFRWRKKTTYLPGEEPLPERPARDALCNVGMLAYIVLCAVLTLMTVLM